ncbi:hypothetical protein CC78DRAFT_81238 [Lojkania enalia]|uniref:Uncharacterized protein n=1 Tax=Lojkania enalia TaxID=147567 RepID=A0A9P4K1W2_9PLEO|nr:hypothetical protein CC78DRAFT_81238 [Didymosphaeria enalia]
MPASVPMVPPGCEQDCRRRHYSKNLNDARSNVADDGHLEFYPTATALPAVTSVMALPPMGGATTITNQGLHSLYDGVPVVNLPRRGLFQQPAILRSAAAAPPDASRAIAHMSATERAGNTLTTTNRRAYANAENTSTAIDTDPLRTMPDTTLTLQGTGGDAPETTQASSSIQFNNRKHVQSLIDYVSSECTTTGPTTPLKEHLLHVSKALQDKLDVIAAEREEAEAKYAIEKEQADYHNRQMLERQARGIQMMSIVFKDGEREERAMASATDQMHQALVHSRQGRWHDSRVEEAREKMRKCDENVADAGLEFHTEMARLMMGWKETRRVPLDTKDQLVQTECRRYSGKGEGRGKVMEKKGKGKMEQ